MTLTGQMICSLLQLSITLVATLTLYFFTFLQQVVTLLTCELMKWEGPHHSYRAVKCLRQQS